MAEEMQGKETYKYAYSADVDLGKKYYGVTLGNNALISYGLPFEQACAEHITNTFKCTKVYILASKSLVNDADALTKLKLALGDKVVGVKVGLKPHTLWSEVIELVNECRKNEIDAIVTLGGCSLTDAAKLMALALANNMTKPDDLKKLPTLKKKADGKINPPTIPIISIPTTLSAAEFTHASGATDDSNNQKHQFLEPIKGPALVIYDAKLSTHTPDSLWLSTGIRAVDHCVEGLCSLESNEGSDKRSMEGLRKLVPGLLRCKKDKSDLQARHMCQLGTIDAIGFVPLGASHGIGHMLGPLGVGHGETSCILLPAVCKYNANHNANNERQAAVVQLLWSIKEMREVAEKAHLQEHKADLGDLLDALIRSLGLPRSLKEVKVDRDKFDALAENSLHDDFLKTNPVSITDKKEVLEILGMVA